MFRAIFAVLAAAFCLLQIPLDAAESPRRIRTAVRDETRYRLRGNSAPRAHASEDDGELSDGETMGGMALQFSLSQLQEEDLDQLLRQVQSRDSDQFHRFLTPEEYATRFGPNPDDVTKVTAWLEEQGFSNIHLARSRSFVSFDGTAGQARRAFHTSFHRYRSDGHAHYANSSDPELPIALREVVANLRGLDNFGLQPRSVQRLQPRLTIQNSDKHLLTPGDVAAIYNSPSRAYPDMDGKGVRIAVIGQSDIDLNDIRSFRAAAALPASDPQIILDGPSPGLKTDGSRDEANLDIEWAGALAKNATIVYVNSTNAFQSLFYAIDNNVAPIISLSFGTCELNLTRNVSEAVSAAFKQANAQGITIIAASGDSGAAACDHTFPATRGFAVDFPASLPYVTGIGGTTFNENSSSLHWIGSSFPSSVVSAYSYIPEVAWNDSGNSRLASTGGGASVYNAKPVWQTGNGVGQDGLRDVPDLAFAASGEHDGYIFCTQGSCANGFLSSTSYFTVGGGTSFGAPVFASILALVVQKLGPQGNINPDLYALAASSPEAFHDITTGNNIIMCQVGSTYCNAGMFGYYNAPGYDQVTGLGSVDASRLIEAWTRLSAADRTPSGAPLTFIPITPCRVADTRLDPGAFGGPKIYAGSIREFEIPSSPCNIPSGAAAYALNVTVAPDGPLQYLTAWPSGLVKPFVSTLNSDGRIKANAAIIPAGRKGGVSFYATDDTHVVLDISGYFLRAPAASALQFYPLTPCRIADTRENRGPLGSPFLAAGQSRNFPVLLSNCAVPPIAQAYALNFTVAPRSPLLYVTAWPAGQPQPLASILNAPTGSTTANAAIIPAGIGGAISAYASSDTELIIDINGYFAPPAAGGTNFYTVNPCRASDTRQQFGAFSGLAYALLGQCPEAFPGRAFVFNATVIPRGPLTYLTLWSNAQSMPVASTLNADANTVTSNMAIVPSTNLVINSFASGPTQLVLDLFGYFAP